MLPALRSHLRRAVREAGPCSLGDRLPDRPPAESGASHLCDRERCESLHGTARGGFGRAPRNRHDRLDRGAPSSIAFRKLEDAEAFQRTHGGLVETFSELMARPMSPPRVKEDKANLSQLPGHHDSGLSHHCEWNLKDIVA